MSTRRSLSTSLLTSLIKPDRTLSASEYSLLSIKRDASLASTRCRRKVRFSGKSEDQISDSYPQDDKTSLFTCPGGTNYKVVFCP
ncbi:hypothetical protein PRUPE_5G093800 [Prunus persica]|uniref:Uncharacterized protein n=1 Tax=Prunus persica TaxID=3760 RepID=A0A251P5X8_PRUPE|nr:hypothetical protein PRUPE_5G093800 [Prunus persica]